MNALILAFAFEQNYHVMRLTHDAGYNVHILGKDCAQGLRFSRLCSSFESLKYDPVSDPLSKAREEIIRAIERTKADVVLPSDVVSTRLVTALMNSLPVPTYPLPSSALFDRMNNKWEFFKLCKQHGVPTPETELYSSLDELKKAVAADKIKFPFIVKPLHAMSLRGIYPVPDRDQLSVLDKIDYSPILVQHFIKGPLVDISILADNGKIVASAVQRNLTDKYLFVKHKALLDGAVQIVAASNYHGVAHFDGIEDEKTGNVYFLECNPRFWFSIFAASNGGLNFVERGLKLAYQNAAQPFVLSDVEVLQSKGAFKKLLTRQKLTDADVRSLKYFSADPLGRLCGKLPMYNDFRATGSASVAGQVAALTALQQGEDFALANKTSEQPVRIAIFGAGGVGGNFGGYMAKAGLDVTFIARGEHARVMRERGLKLQTLKGDLLVQSVKVAEDPASLGPVDVVFLCLKSWQLEENAGKIAALVGPNTVVIPLQNWAEAADFLVSRLGTGKVLGGVCYTISSTVAPGVIQAGGGQIMFGELDKLSSALAERLSNVFANVPGISVKNVPDIRRQMWKKFVWISSVGALGAATGLSVGGWRKNPQNLSRFKTILREAFAVAKAKGVKFKWYDYMRTVRLLNGWSDDLKTSMQRDIAAGVRSELDFQIGAIVRLARELNVPVPASEAIYASLASIERQSQKKTA